LKHQVGIYDLLKASQVEKGKTIIAVTHDINLASQYCDEILLLGTVGSYHIGKTKTVLLPEQIKETFDVDVFAGGVGEEKFFIPLGKFAKKSRKTNKEA
jgi:iron complex transport system ATP-binding protein